jgi:hypothetical protein
MGSESAIMPEKLDLHELETMPGSTRTFQIDVGVFN